MTADMAELGMLIRRRREELGLSALALSRAAGLSMNYVRNVERCKRRPQLDPLRRICSALGFDDETIDHALRLAGFQLRPPRTDAVPTMLSSDEYVGLRDAINALHRPPLEPPPPTPPGELPDGTEVALRIRPGQVLFWVAPAILAAEPSLAPAFWQRYAAPIRTRASGQPLTPLNLWTLVVAFLREELAERPDSPQRVARLVSRWSWSDSVAACRFRRRADQRRWGFRNVPVQFASQVAIARSAALLAPSRPPDLPLPPPPSLADALRHYIHVTAGEDATLDGDRRAPSLAFVLDLARHVAAALPDLAAANASNSDAVNGCADLLRRAVADAPSAEKRRKGR